MTPHPGIGPPHTPWPDDKKFPSSLSLDLLMPDASAPSGAKNVTGSAEWEYGVLPEGWLECEGKGVVFGVGECELMVGIYGWMEIRLMACR